MNFVHIAVSSSNLFTKQIF